MDNYTVLTRRIIKLEEELERERKYNGEKSVLIQLLFEDLRKCDPLKGIAYCPFCNDNFAHKEDCKYLRLTEG